MELKTERHVALFFKPSNASTYFTNQTWNTKNLGNDSI